MRAHDKLYHEEHDVTGLTTFIGYCRRLQVSVRKILSAGWEQFYLSMC